LLHSDLTLTGVEPKFIFELYTLEAIIHQSRKESVPLMIAMEKAITAEAGATIEQKAILDREMSTTLDSMQAREKAADAYARRDYTTALVLYELVQHFDETHARWMNKLEDYLKSNNPFVSKLLEIPFTMAAQPDGAAALENNLKQMGPIA